jgi:peroxiredoxin family protein
MPTKHKRRKIVFKKKTNDKLDWLVEEANKKSNKKVYPCEVLEELIENAYTIKKTFR